MTEGSIPCPSRVNAKARPDEPAIITREWTWSWRELDGLVTRSAAYLDELAPKGSRIAVRMSTSVDLVALSLASLRTGHVLAQISTRLPQATATRQARLIGAVATVEAVRLPTVIRKPRSVGDQSIPLDRWATVIFTSGSTGEPKAALHSVGNHVWSARGLVKVMPLKPEDRWLLNLPIYHVGGLAIVYRCALTGAALVLPDPEMTTKEAIETFKVTHTSLVATQLTRLLREEDVRLGTLKAVLLGGSAIHRDLLMEATGRGLPIFTSYGLTEMASTVTVVLNSGQAGGMAASGFVLPHREVEIRGGQILVRGETCFVGYVDVEGILRPFDDEGWFATGDLGFIDELGRLHVTGRIDNQFVSGGENIQPEEIEQALEELAGVGSALVVSVADAEFGHRPIAFVQMDAELNADAIISSLSDVLPRFKIPVAIYPLPPIGELKPDRNLLRKEAERRWTK